MNSIQHSTSAGTSGLSLCEGMSMCKVFVYDLYHLLLLHAAGALLQLLSNKYGFIETGP